MSTASESRDVFVVVHGMGEQVPGNTTAALMRAFIAAADDSPLGTPPPPLPVSRAFLMARQRDEGFVDGTEIPGCETQLRGMAFAEVHWADITDKHFRASGVPFADWSASLVRQLTLRSEDSDPRVSGMIRDRQQWLFPLLRVLRGGLKNINYLLRPRLGWISDLAFNKYFGDVQMYAESRDAQIEARKRFHDVMSTVHEKLALKFPSAEHRYHVIAHSLGTVLSLEALVTAHVSETVRHAARGQAAPILPVQGEFVVADLTKQLAQFETAVELDYSGESAAAPVEFPWVASLRTFVTLGSPIDKFLVLWDRNYTEIPSQLFERPGDRVRHYNFCDEQDPFGHRLNVMYETGGASPCSLAPVVNVVFDQSGDCVFSRYPQPVVAHTRYFGDPPLGRAILDLTRGRADKTALPESLARSAVADVEDPVPDAGFRFSQSRFFQALGWNYFWIQTLAMLILAFSLTALITADDWKTKAILAVPTTWAFWMILPEFLWLVAAWRVLVDGLRDDRERRERRALQWFAMITSVVVDLLFVLSFPVVVICAATHKHGLEPHQVMMVLLGATLAVALVVGKSRVLIVRRTRDSPPTSAVMRIIWFALIGALGLLVATWEIIPASVGRSGGEAVISWLCAYVPDWLTRLGARIPQPALRYLLPLSGAVAIAGAFDLILRLAATLCLRFRVNAPGPDANEPVVTG